jgi:tyrosyl-tRNA synthetase
LADLQAFLDDMKAPLYLVPYRVRYYTQFIKAMLKALHVPLNRIRFITGSAYQFSPA